MALDEEGNTHGSDERFNRVEAGVGLAGTWRSTSAGINASEEFGVDRVENYGLRFDYTKQQIFYITSFDGAFVPYGGAYAIPSLRML